jgi:hypothetical protein
MAIAIPLKAAGLPAQNRLAPRGYCPQAETIETGRDRDGRGI